MSNSNDPSRRLRTQVAVPGAVLVFLAGAFLAVAGTRTNLEEALQSQRSLVAESPGDVGLLNDLGNLQALAGQMEEAEETYLQALVMDPSNLATLYNLALVQHQNGNSKEARKTLEQVLELDPQHAWGHYQLGTLYLENKNRTKALKHYAAAFSADRSLTSLKVNPHIVENKLASEALLKAYVEESSASKAPRIYENPGDVADLLIPPVPVEPASDEAIEVAPEAETSSVSTRSRSSYVTSVPADSADNDDAASLGANRPMTETPSTQPAGDADATSAAPLMIDASSLQERPAQSGSSSGTSGQALGGTSGVPGTSASSSASSRQTGSAASATVEDPGMPTESPTTFGAGTTDSPGGFTPGLQSTGRLEIELLPATESEPSASST